MLRRISGLLLILRALSPVIIVLVLGGTLALVLNDVRAAVDPPLQSIQTEIGEIQTTVETVRGDIEAVNTEVSSLLSTLSSFSIPNLIPNIPANLSFPSLDIPNASIPVPTVSVRTSSTTIAGVSISYPSGLNIGSSTFNLNFPAIPSFSVPLPGLSQIDDALRDALSGVTGVFDSSTSAFDRIGDLNVTLQLVPGHVDAITSQAQQLLNSLARVLSRWAETLLIVMLVLLVLVIIYFGVPLLDDLTRGWRMLRGLPDAGAATS
ncbi:MAG: hypothetical protein K8J31_29665 [Anaerolineae bacterium]|nr:hypothetical protein [Anaerolineae bacterium]